MLLPQCGTRAARGARLAAHATAHTRPLRCAAGRHAHAHAARCAAAFNVGPPKSGHDAAVERAVLAWVDTFIIGLELCPFARGARRGTRVAVCRAETRDAALQDLWTEMSNLEAAPLDSPATTLFVLPSQPFAANWDAFMAFHAEASEAAAAISDRTQLVPFHPCAVYGDDERDAAEFATRAPLPIVHLLREADVRRAETEWDGGDIVSANADRLRGEGVGALAGALAAFQRIAGVDPS